MSISLLGRRWQCLSPRTDKDLLAVVLANRGLDTADKIEHFLIPELKHLTSLETIPQIKEAASFILQAIEQNKKITVYGDYDVDGVTGTSLFVLALRELGAQNLNFYVPHRFTEGYGLNPEAIKQLKESGTELILTVDCGISNYEEIKYAKELGLSVVVTDHHMPPVVLPEADFLINPKLNNLDFSARNLSGVGVAFKLLEQMFQLQGNPPYSKTKKYLDLVVLGTIADIVPLLEENRILTVYGLEQINKKSARVGIKALIDVAGLEPGRITAKDIGFGLGPRINAAGRMDKAMLAVDLLLEENYHKAKQIALELDRLNTQRQEIGQTIKRKVVEEIEKLPNKESEKVFVLAGQDWHPGIIGIVASQIVKLYNRPTALIAIHGVEGRGSVRSLEDLDIFEPLNRCSYLLKDFGGHREAAGFEILTERISEFKDKFTSIIAESIGFENLVPVLKIETELRKEEISMKLAEEIDKLAPFGQNNALPVFSCKDLAIYDFKKIGDGKHLKFSLTDGTRNIDGVGFNMGDLYDKLAHADLHLEIAFSVSINTWQGRRSLQLLIKDLRPITN